jgi:uncharacterized protein YjiS (DUF1127 family)
MNMQTIAAGQEAAGTGWRRRLWNWWDAYATRRGRALAAAHLRSFSDEQLKDIGLSRCEIEFAIANGRASRHRETVN